MDKVQKHSSFDTNTPSSESYKNEPPPHTFHRTERKPCFLR